MGISVVLDWGFWTREQRVVFRRRAEALGARVETYFLEADQNELRARLARRNAAAPPGTFVVSDAELDSWASCYEAPSAAELETQKNDRTIFC